MKREQIFNLSVIMSINCFCGISIDLLGPFYPSEALARDVSVTMSGLVFSSAFVVLVIGFETNIIGEV